MALQTVRNTRGLYITQQTPKTVANALPNKKCPRGGSNPGPVRHQTNALPPELNGMVVPVRLAHSEADVLKVVYGLIYIDTRHSWRRNPFACIALVLTGGSPNNISGAGGAKPPGIICYT